MDNCPACGLSYALVGRVHNCKPRAEPPPVQSETYKYRDPEKRRVQVAKAMRAYRARKNTKMELA